MDGTFWRSSRSIETIAVMKTITSFRFVLLLLIMALLLACCQSKDESISITRAFTEFVIAIQNGDLEKVGDFIHPDSPFYKQTSDEGDRFNHWAVQHLKLTAIGGKIEVFEIDGAADRKTLKCRLFPGQNLYDPVDVNVVYAKEKSNWKILAPEKGLDLVPIEPSDVKIERSQDQDLGNGRTLRINIKSQKVSGPGVEEWMKIIRARKAGETGYSISDAMSENKSE